MDRCQDVLRTYPISIVQVSDKDLPAVCKIFQRINQGGKRLDRFDLISAMTFSPEFDLRQKFKIDVNDKLEREAFGAISPAIVTQLMALISKGACTEKAEFSLTADDIQSLWKSAVSSISLAAHTLRKCVGVQNATYLPYDALLTLLAYFYAKSNQRALTDAQLKWVQQWFWRASFSQYYGSGGPTKMGRDKELFDKLISGSSPRFEPPLALSADILVETKMTWSRAAVRNAFLCLLATLKPVHLINNSELDLVNGDITDFTSPEKHHIFPQAFLAEHGTGATEVHALPNFCFLPAELNKRILDKRPSIYFAELREENPQFDEAAKTHLIPTGEDAGIRADDYLQFLKTRSQLIIEEIGRLTGLSTAPREDQWYVTMKRLETSLRDLIHNTLRENVGTSYWRSAVPVDVRSEVKARIDAHLRKQPMLNPADFEVPEEKLRFCNFGDYVKIIQIGSNWPFFENVFRRRSDFDRHIEALSDFRNNLMHNRPLSEYGRRAGELAVIWFDAVLAKEPPSEPDDEALVEEPSASTVGNSDIAQPLTLIVGPSPEAKITAAEKEKFYPRHEERMQFWTGLLEVANKKTQLHAGRTPSRHGHMPGPSGVAGINFNYVVLEHEARVEVWISRGTDRSAENKEIFKKLFDQKDQIERVFGEKLDWQPLEGKALAAYK